MTLPTLLSSIGLVLPNVHSLEASGSVELSADGRAVCVVPAALLILDFARPTMDLSQDPALAVRHEADISFHKESGPANTSMLSVSPGRSRSPAPSSKVCRSQASAALQSSCSRAAVDACSAQLALLHGGGPAMSKRNRCPAELDALRWCRTEDASGIRPSTGKGALTAPPLSMHMVAALLNDAPWVYQEGDMPPAPLRPTGVKTDTNLQTTPQQTPPIIPEPEEDLRRVPVLLLAFQGPPQQHTLWVSNREGLDSFMVRASILLNPDTTRFDLHAVTPQVHLQHFLLLLSPKWWRLARICPLACYVMSGLEGPFAHAAAAEETLDTALPQAAFHEGRALDVYLPPAQPGLPDELPSPVVPERDLPPGALLVFQAEGEPAPVLPDTLAHLYGLPHVAAGDYPEITLYQPHSCDVVLLGVEYEQFIMRCASGPILHQVAQRLGMRAEDVFLQRQYQTFPELVVAGRGVGACWGVRSKAIFGEVPAGRGVFIDSRALGRPVVYRSVLARRLCPSDVCGMLDVPIPSHYCAYAEGGFACADLADYFLIEDGMNLTVWLDFAAPQPSPASP